MTPGTFGQIESSTSGTRASPQATPPSSSRKRRDSASDVSLPPSSRRRQDSPVSSHIDDDVVPVSPPTDDATDPVPPPEGDTVADVEPYAFGGALVDLSLLPLYQNHIVRHILEIEVTLVGFFFFT